MIYLKLRRMARSMPRLRRPFPLGMHALVIRTLVPILLVAAASWTTLRAASSEPVVWTGSSIGAAYAQIQSPSCSAVPTSCPIFSVMSAGGLSANDDVYGFMNRPLRGDGYLVARVGEIGGVASGLAGLMIRASLTQGAAQLSVLRSTAGGLVIRQRAQTNGTVTQSSAPGLSTSTWLRLERRGQTITLSRSADGTQWSLIQSATIALQETASVGLAVTSQRPDAMATASMSNVQLVSHSDLPGGWSKVDLGGVASQVQVSESFWSISQWSSGGTSSDGLSFVYQRVTGDAEVSVRVASIAPAAGVAGLMVRGTLDPASPHLWLRTSPSGQRSVRRQLAAGLAATTTTIGSGGMPAWLKLVRQGVLVSLYQSTNGTTWTLLATEAVDLPASIYIGWAVARSTASSLLAVLDNVRLSAASANEVPTISLTAPSSATTVFEGDPFTISAIASDRDDRVEAVEFFVDSTRVGVDTTAPYVASWTATGVGLHMVSALARDSDGAVVRTPAVAVAVLARSGYDEGSPSGGTTGTGPGGTTGTGSGGTTGPGSGGTTGPSSGGTTGTGTGGTTGTGTGGTAGTGTGGTVGPVDTTSTWRLLFRPSPDHDRTVDRYTAEIYLLNGFVLVATRDLGRPAVVGSEITVDLTTLIRPLPLGLYRIAVQAVDDSTHLRSSPAGFDFTR